MPAEHGFEHVADNGRAYLRCTVPGCDAIGEPWEWPLHRRYQHAQAHLGVADAAAAEQKFARDRADLLAASAKSPRRDRRVVLPPRQCANPYCSLVFQPRRSTARYCCGACRVAVHRQRHGRGETPTT